MTEKLKPRSGQSTTGLVDNLEEGSSLRFPVLTKDDITTLAHYYRGEMSRMMSWRDRLDRTTNWAIGAVTAMLSITLATASAHHSVLIFSMVLVFLLLQIESRRYRFFHLFGHACACWNVITIARFSTLRDKLHLSIGRLNLRKHYDTPGSPSVNAEP